MPTPSQATSSDWEPVINVWFEKETRSWDKGNVHVGSSTLMNTEQIQKSHDACHTLFKLEGCESELTHAYEASLDSANGIDLDRARKSFDRQVDSLLNNQPSNAKSWIKKVPPPSKYNQVNTNILGRYLQANRPSAVDLIGPTHPTFYLHTDSEGKCRAYHNYHEDSAKRYPKQLQALGDIINLSNASTGLSVADRTELVKREATKFGQYPYIYANSDEEQSRLLSQGCREISHLCTFENANEAFAIVPEADYSDCSVYYRTPRTDRTATAETLAQDHRHQWRTVWKVNQHFSLDPPTPEQMSDIISSANAKTGGSEPRIYLLAPGTDPKASATNASKVFKIEIT